MAIQLFAEKRVRVVGRRVEIDGCATPAAECLISPALKH
jgi:hypothetical protein